MAPPQSSDILLPCNKCGLRLNPDSYKNHWRMCEDQRENGRRKCAPANSLLRSVTQQRCFEQKRIQRIRPKTSKLPPLVASPVNEEFVDEMRNGEKKKMVTFAPSPIGQSNKVVRSLGVELNDGKQRFTQKDNLDKINPSTYHAPNSRERPLGSTEQDDNVTIIPALMSETPNKFKRLPSISPNPETPRSKDEIPPSPKHYGVDTNKSFASNPMYNPQECRENTFVRKQRKKWEKPPHHLLSVAGVEGAFYQPARAYSFTQQSYPQALVRSKTICPDHRGRILANNRTSLSDSMYQSEVDLMERRSGDLPSIITQNTFSRDNTSQTIDNARQSKMPAQSFYIDLSSCTTNNTNTCKNVEITTERIQRSDRIDEMESGGNVRGKCPLCGKEITDQTENYHFQQLCQPKAPRRLPSQFRAKDQGSISIRPTNLESHELASLFQQIPTKQYSGTNIRNEEVNQSSKADLGYWWMSHQETLDSLRNLMVPPRAKKNSIKPCNICGKDFGSSSIKIHQTQCLKKLEMQNAKLQLNR